MRIGVCESVEKLVRYDELAAKVANDMAYEWQKRITKGDCFKRVHDGIEIYGEVIGDYDESARVCRCYSLLCPEGETGMVYISQMSEPIDNARFNKVKNKLSRAWKLANTILGNGFALGNMELVGA